MARTIFESLPLRLARRLARGEYVAREARCFVDALVPLPPLLAPTVRRHARQATLWRLWKMPPPPIWQTA